MMYPRNRSAASRGGKRTKKNFLNPYQREELKKRLTEKFTKLYGLNNPNAVKSELDNFFKQKSEINANNLRGLEQRVKVSCLKGKSLVKPPSQISNGKRGSRTGQGQRGPTIVTHGNQQTSKSKRGLKGPRRRSSATGSRGSQNNQRLPDIQGTRLQSAYVGGRNPVGVDHLTEEDQWGAINKYNFYLYKQEKRLEKQREIERRKKMKKELDEQVREKERRKQHQKEEKLSYVTAQNKIMQIEYDQEMNRQQLRRDKVSFEKDMRDLQMKEIEERKRFEHEQEKTLDSYILGKIKHELKEEQLTQAQKKKAKMYMMREMMEENNERKRKLLEKQELERLEDIDLQNKAILMSEELEKQRALEFEEKASAISRMIKSSQDKVQDIKNKNYEMEMKNQRYQELREKCKRSKENRETQLANKRKIELRHFLDRQVEEKKNREHIEKERDYEQAETWKKEKVDHEEFIRTKTKLENKTYKTYQNCLKDQMAERNMKDRMAKGNMNNNEAAMNRVLLSKVGDLRTQNMNDEEKVRRTPMTNNIY